MNIGSPKEIRLKERRISCTPGEVCELVQNGRQVWVDKGPGIGQLTFRPVPGALALPFSEVSL